jgi:hypothetical protein
MAFWSDPKRLNAKQKRFIFYNSYYYFYVIFLLKEKDQFMICSLWDPAFCLYICVSLFQFLKQVTDFHETLEDTQMT